MESEEKMLEEARQYAVCIIAESYRFMDFAISLIDYLGEAIIPYLKGIYKDMAPLVFSYGKELSDLKQVDTYSDEEMRRWFDKYKERLKKDEPSQQALFQENIDELQFLVENCRQSEEFQKMLDFMGKFKHLAPYNAMMVQMQFPGAQLVLTGKEWARDYNRRIKPNARQLITLRQFGPIQCMFDVSDTEPMPGYKITTENEILDRWNSSLTRSEGKIEKELLETLIDNLPVYGIYLDDSFDAAATYGGYIMPYQHEIVIPLGKKGAFNHVSRFLISVNRRQKDEAKFHTICHELGHLFCRHQSYDPAKKRDRTIKEREFEAETVAWLVCKRHGITNPSEEYLATYARDGVIPICSWDRILMAVTEIEKMLSSSVSVKKSLWYKEDKAFKEYYDFHFKKKTKPKKQIKL